MPEITYTVVMPVKSINKAASFRKSAKFPTVTYVHSSKTEGKGKGCAIFRSAEPSVKLLGSGSEEDRLMIKKMSEKFSKIKSENPRSMKAQDVLQIFSPRAEAPIIGQTKFGFESASVYMCVINKWCSLDYKLLSQSYQEMWKTMHSMHVLGE